MNSNRPTILVLLLILLVPGRPKDRLGKPRAATVRGTLLEKAPQLVSRNYAGSNLVEISRGISPEAGNRRCRPPHCGAHRRTHPPTPRSSDPSNAAATK